MWRNCCCLTCSDMMNVEQTLTFKEKQRLQRSDVMAKSTQSLSLTMDTQVLSRRRIWMTLSGLHKWALYPEDVSTWKNSCSVWVVMAWIKWLSRIYLSVSLFFAAGDLKEDVTPDADYLFSLLEPHSREGTSRRCFEEDIIDVFQDIRNDFETGNVVGHLVPIACNKKRKKGMQTRTRLWNTRPLQFTRYLSLTSYIFLLVIVYCIN